MTTDSLDLADDGRIRLTFNDDTIILKVPKVKEYREIKGAAQEANTQIRERAAAEKEAAETDQVNVITTDLTVIYGPVIQKAIDILGDKPAPDIDEMPVWLVDDSAALTSMLVHWRTVPLGRGGVVPSR